MVRLAGVDVAPDAAESRLRVVRWNSDKRYLLDLAAAEWQSCRPSWWHGGARSTCPACAPSRGLDVVVKPAIGASAKGAERFADAATGSRDGAGQRHLDALLASGDALIQPYQPAVEQLRERSLVLVGGVFSHAFTKPPFLRGIGDGLGEVLHEASAEERSLADQALRAAPGPTTYARVDLVPTPDGPRLMELELIEPDLGLRLYPPSIDAFIEAILD